MRLAEPKPIQVIKPKPDIYEQSSKRIVGGKVVDLWRIEISWITTFVAGVSNPSFQFTNIAIPFDQVKLVYARYFMSYVAGAPIILPYSSYMSLVNNPGGYDEPVPTIGGASPAGTVIDQNGFPACIIARTFHNFGQGESNLDFRFRNRLIPNVQCNWIGDGAVGVTVNGPGSLMAIGAIVTGKMEMRFEAIEP